MRYVLIIMTLFSFVGTIWSATLAVTTPSFIATIMIWTFATVMWGLSARNAWKAHRA